MDFSSNISITVVQADQKKVQSIRILTNNTFVLRFEREDLCFKAGQYLSVGTNKSVKRREYSVYSGENEEYLEILVREVLDGNVSLSLMDCQPGDFAEVKGGFGKMTLNENEIKGKKHLFIASGTGIAPFHSYIKSYPEIDYKLLHGVRSADEAYDMEEYAIDRYILCTSRETSGDYHGRVTDYLRELEIDPSQLYHICGNSKMIYETQSILRQKGVMDENIRTEVYF